jgi:hypothetical protein
MFTRFKNWLRAIIAEEVAKVTVSLSKERATTIATLKNVENAILQSIIEREDAFIERIKATIEAEHDAFVERLRCTRQHISDGEPNVWKADEETVAADHALKLVK